MAGKGVKAKSLGEKAEELDIDLFIPVMSSLLFDSYGSLIPVGAAENFEKNGFGFLAVGHFKMSLNEAEQYGVPDMNTLIKLPWKPNVGWLQCNVYQNGKPFPQCARRKLVELQEHAKSLGFIMKSGFEAEFSLLKKDSHEIADVGKSGDYFLVYQNPHETLTKVDFVSEVINVMKGLGWKPYQVEHEGMPGQYEINYEYSDALTAGDRHSFFKFMIKELALKHGMRASFMPFPFTGAVMGNGLHMNLSLWDPDKNINLFPSDTSSKNEVEVSALAEHFIAGILAHAQALTAILCPSINSYKRLHASGVSSLFGQQTISWGRVSRYPLIRLPNSERMELRCGDGSCNPYLCQAAILAAGLDGIVNKMELDRELQLEGDVWLDKKNTPTDHLKVLPESLPEACDYLDKDEVLRKYLGNDLVDAFLFVKKAHWKEFIKQVTPFEIGLADEY